MHGAVLDNAPHRHHALQVVWAEPGCLARVNGAEGPTFIIESQVEHHLVLDAGLVCLLEAQSQAAHRLRAQWLGEHSLVAAPRAAAPVDLQSVDALVAELAPASAASSPVDARVRRVLRWVDAQEHAGRFDEVTLAGALELVGLSESRFAHVFSEQVATPWRSYLVWRRALVAASWVSSGSTLTEAAHRAGYSDSAHLSRQFRALFGYAPSVALARSGFVQS